MYDEEGVEVETTLPDADRRHGDDGAGSSSSMSALGAIVATDTQKMKVKEELADTQKQLGNVKDSEEMQGMIIGPLEEMKREMKKGMPFSTAHSKAQKLVGKGAN